MPCLTTCCHKCRRFKTDCFDFVEVGPCQTPKDSRTCLVKGLEPKSGCSHFAPRFVLVDMGYQTIENWYTVKVIESRMTKNLFDDGESEELLVEFGGERIWVIHWKNIGGTPE